MHKQAEKLETTYNTYMAGVAIWSIGKRASSNGQTKLCKIDNVRDYEMCMRIRGVASARGIQ